MLGLIFLSAMAVLFGFVFGQAFTWLAQRFRWQGRVCVRTSYGGVQRNCTEQGGLIVALALAGGLSPHAMMGTLPASAPLGVVVLAVLGRFFYLRTSSLSHYAEQRILFVGAILFFLLVPDRSFLMAIMSVVALAHLAKEVAGADLVPGIPAALFAPGLLSAGALLVILHDTPEGLFGLVAAGALIAVQKWHRFPPQLILGPLGVALLVAINLAMGGLLLAHGNVLAFLILWSFTLLGAVFDLFVHPGGTTIDPFEKARLRGEPEAGLAFAAGSLACANVVVLWSVLRSGPVLQMVAAAFCFMLVYQFRRFLVRGKTVDAVRPPWHRDIS
jgi:hypothetical protein